MEMEYLKGESTSNLLFSSLLIPLLRGKKDPSKVNNLVTFPYIVLLYYESCWKWFDMTKSSMEMEKPSMLLSFLEEG